MTFLSSQVQNTFVKRQFLPLPMCFLSTTWTSSIWLLFLEECEAIKNMIVESLCVDKVFCSAFPLNRESYLITVGSVDGSVLSLRLIWKGVL